MANKTICALTYGDTHVFTLPYGECSTAAATAAKTVTVQDGKFSLETGARVLVKFTVTNTASSPTLNVSGTGAKSIYYRNSAISAGYLAANRIYEFVYDGSQYELIGDVNTNTTTTTGTTNKTGTKLFLAGATSQASAPTTYSNSGVYIGTDNCLYSNSKKVATTNDISSISNQIGEIKYGIDLNLDNNWLKCIGQDISGNDYPELFNKIGPIFDKNSFSGNIICSDEEYYLYNIYYMNGYYIGVGGWDYNGWQPCIFYSQDYINWNKFIINQRGYEYKDSFIDNGILYILANGDSSIYTSIMYSSTPWNSSSWVTKSISSTYKKYGYTFAKNSKGFLVAGTYNSRQYLYKASSIDGTWTECDLYSYFGNYNVYNKFMYIFNDKFILIGNNNTSMLIVDFDSFSSPQIYTFSDNFCPKHCEVYNNELYLIGYYSSSDNIVVKKTSDLSTFTTVSTQVYQTGYNSIASVDMKIHFFNDLIFIIEGISSNTRTMIIYYSTSFDKSFKALHLEKIGTVDIKVLNNRLLWFNSNATNTYPVDSYARWQDIKNIKLPNLTSGYIEGFIKVK